MPASTRQPTVLVVEDEAIVARDLLGQLRELGYAAVGPAATAAEALEMTRALSPDLVLMDIQLSGAPMGDLPAPQATALPALASR